MEQARSTQAMMAAGALAAAASLVLMAGCSGSRSAHEASDLMAEHGIRHLAVSEEGVIVGMVSVRDLLRYFKNWGTL